MDVEIVKCECCGLKEDCTAEYIVAVKDKFGGKWLCGLCSEAVSDEVLERRHTIEDAVWAHMSFCRKYKSSPASRVADGMRQMLRRRSDLANKTNNTSSSNKKYARSTSAF